ncbi:ficolin-1-like [Acanthaster planci]|uniref:Ficolin-1-like n=1 Tax=Acanthaster planci TaxID=133434 RepID=A0A8B8A1H8_ACAPL|nr:ficolin-1-like [Acanthaster planci]
MVVELTKMLFALGVIIIAAATTSVSAKVCVLGTEPDPGDGGRVKFVIPPGDPCTCAEVRLGGHNAYAPPRPRGTVYVGIGDLQKISADGLREHFPCTTNKPERTSTSNPRESTPKVTTGEKGLTTKVTTRAQGSTSEVATIITEADSTHVVSTLHETTMAPELTEPAANCQEILDAGISTSGVYTIQHNGETMQVYCSMESDASYIEYAEGFGDLTGEFWLGSEKLHDLTRNGSWELVITLRAFDGQNATVFQRRINGSVSFNRTWQEYAEGFGDLTGEFWLGNEKLYDLTRTGKWELVITLRAFDGQNATVRYEDFKIESVGEKYKLDVGSLHTDAGHAGDSLLNGQEFSTMDCDNDESGSRNCAAMFHGGWWYKKCNSNKTGSNLNGLYHSSPNVSDYQGIQRVSLRGESYSLKGCEMKIRCGP